MGAPSVLIWRISTHKRVSHYMLQIDEALGRLNRQVGRLSEYDGQKSGSSGVMVLNEETLLLDPQSNKVSIRTHALIQVHVHARTHAHTHACTHTRMHIYTHAHTCAYTQEHA